MVDMKSKDEMTRELGYVFDDRDRWASVACGLKEDLRKYEFFVEHLLSFSTGMDMEQLEYDWLKHCRQLPDYWFEEV
jgi:hypothetical protein